MSQIRVPLDRDDPDDEDAVVWPPSLVILLGSICAALVMWIEGWV